MHIEGDAPDGAELLEELSQVSFLHLLWREAPHVHRPVGNFSSIQGHPMASPNQVSTKGLFWNWKNMLMCISL